MSLKITKPEEIPAETVRVVRAAFPKGNPYTLIRDELGGIFRDEQFADLYLTRGQPGLAPWRLAPPRKNGGGCIGNHNAVHGKSERSTSSRSSPGSD